MSEDPSRGTPGLAAGFRAGGRRAVRLSAEDLVATGPMPGGGRFPLLVQPGVPDLDAAAWASGRRERIGGWLLEHGAILLRGFAVDSAEQFRELARAVTPGLLDYQERAAPRVEVAKHVFTSTEYPADQAIPLHHEMSYSHNWPGKIWFFCLQPAERGGATPIVDDRELFPRLDAAIKRRFLERRVMYVRNYGGGVDLPWQEVFQTRERAEVEAYCRQARMECEWRDGDRLRTRAVRQVVATHPRTGDTVWFNHAHMFHVSNLEPSVRAALLAEFDEDELPRNAFYGDGSPIEDAVLDEIRALYRSLAVTFPWQRGDVLLLDNVLASHGREPFTGPRRIVVAMADLDTDPAHAGPAPDAPAPRPSAGQGG
jgi:alpha-ketoglutarate-dependent taurine dioxygenase